MILRHNAATTHRPEGERYIDAPIIKVDIAHHAAQLKNEDAWAKNDRNAITLFKTEQMSIVLVAMHKNAGMVSHADENIVYIQVLDGILTLNIDGDDEEITAGHIVALHEGNNYRIHANEECTFILTINNIKHHCL